MAVLDFPVSGASPTYAPCDPDGPVPETTADIAGVRFLWGDGCAEAIGPAQTPYLLPILAHLRP